MLADVYVGMGSIQLHAVLRGLHLRYSFCLGDLPVMS